MSYKFSGTGRRINPAAFTQSTHWFDGKGNEHEISKMPVRYALAVVEYLYKNKPAGWSSDCNLMRALRQRIINQSVPGVFNAKQAGKNAVERHKDALRSLSAAPTPKTEEAAREELGLDWSKWTGIDTEDPNF